MYPLAGCAKYLLDCSVFLLVNNLYVQQYLNLYNPNILFDSRPFSPSYIFQTLVAVPNRHPRGLGGNPRMVSTLLVEFEWWNAANTFHHSVCLLSILLPLYLAWQGPSQIIRITSTIIAPTPLLAAYFLIVGRLIVILGPQYSRLRPALCEHLFLNIL